jgi:tetratricopeptide (TPR) repeat protein
MQSRIAFGVVGLMIGLGLGTFIARRNAPAPRAVTTAAPAATSSSDHFTRLLTVRPQADSFELLIEVANRDMDDGKFAQAIGSYERALRLRDDAHAWTDLGVCYRNTGRQAQALEAFERAVKSDPNLWQAEYNRAVLLADLNRLGEARAIATTLRARYPAQAEIVALGDALERRQ